MNFTEAFLLFPVQAMTLEVMRMAVAICDRLGFSYRDNAILAEARIFGCDALYAEDLSTKQEYEDLRVVNPFAS